MTKDEALKLALEALTYIHAETSTDEDELIDKAITAINQALANDALDKKAENARELGLDYEPAPVAKHYVDGGHLVYPAAQRQWVGLTRWEIDAKLKENK
jgi:hypothetical protein